MSIYEKNLAILRITRPALAERLAHVVVPPHFQVVQARNGQPILKIGEVSLHSPYDPAVEGQRWAKAQEPLSAGEPLVIFGLGLGYHWQSFLDTADPLYVVEPSLEVARLALEQVDLTPLLERQGLRVGRDFYDLPRPARLLVHQPTLRQQRGAYRRLERWLADPGQPGPATGDAVPGRPLKILVISPLYGGSYPIAQYCTRAFNRLGHQAEMLDHGPFFPAYQALERISRTPQHGLGLKQGLLRLISEAILVKAAEYQPDLVWALAQAPLDSKLIEALKDRGIRVAYWFVEDFRVMTYWQELAPVVDAFLVIQEEPFYQALEKAGVEKYAFLPLATDPEIFRPLELSPAEKRRFGSALAFVGAGYLNRRQVFQGLTDFDFKIWGSDWDLKSPLGPYIQCQGARISPEDSVKIFNASRINLNLHSSPFHQGINPEGDYLNPRVFDLAACGAFQLVDWRGQLPRFFKPGEEIVTFTTVEELRQQIDYYLAYPEEREAIACRSRERVRREHTYEHRLAQALTLIEELNPGTWPTRQPTATTIGQLLNRLPDDSSLKSYLGHWEPTDTVSLEGLANRIAQGQGKLSEPEAIILFLNEFRQGLQRGQL
ncbi:MAG: glycosyltransferase [Desulfobacca sp.]|nr:glycosyltransferase [Desulfobacca sp.]